MSEQIQKAALALVRARAQIAKAEQKLKPLKEVADALEDELRVAMIESKLESFSIKEATFSLKHSVIAELFDDEAFFKYVKKSDAWDLVRKQPVIAACRARWDEGIEVPGVKAGKVVSLSIRAKS